MTDAVPHEYSSNFKSLSLPIEFLRDEELSCEDKIILAEIYHLQKGAGCFACNAHFGGLTNLKERSVRRHLTDLEKRGYLYAENRYSLRRRLWISDDLQQTIESGRKSASLEDGSKKATGTKNAGLEVQATRHCPTGERGHLSTNEVTRDPDTRPAVTAKKSKREQEEKSKQNNNRIGDFSLPDWLPASDWNEWEAHCERVGVKLSPERVKAQIATLEKLESEGHEFRMVIKEAIDRGWKDFYPLPASKRSPLMTDRFGRMRFGGHVVY
jgi:hypothetical protein